MPERCKDCQIFGGETGHKHCDKDTEGRPVVYALDYACSNIKRKEGVPDDEKRE